MYSRYTEKHSSRHICKKCGRKTFYGSFYMYPYLCISAFFCTKCLNIYNGFDPNPIRSKKSIQVD